jgi:peroxiredoxin Q/BCP
MGTVEPGMMAPDFELPSSRGSLSLAFLRGRKVVLYFFPRAETPGCTRETIDFNRLRPEFEKHGVSIVGVSADPLKVQEKFGAKHQVAFPLATVDSQHGTLEAYGVWAEKRMYGRKFMGIVRTTFLIDAKGRIAKVWRNVRVPGHADEVLAAVRSM